ncbi:MAG: tetratricopeptide repeat protein [Hyphomicrobiales bacterium]
MTSFHSSASTGNYTSFGKTLFAWSCGPVVALGLLLGQAQAVGTDSSEPPKPTETTQKCKDGQIWDKDTKTCVSAQQGMFDDDTLFDAARELAYDGQYEHAIDLLQLASNPDDPRILNYLGFSNRKAGRMDVGMGYYKEALKRDPDYILARSYMGQAYLQQNQRTAARDQLLEIEARGGKGTWAHTALVMAMKNASTY